MTKYRVLIADDDQHVLDGLGHIVDWAALGLEIVASARDGAEAKRYIESNRVDILLTDIKMPEMSGLELIQWIRGSELGIRCIVLSGHDDYPYMQQAIRLDIENYLLKSINECELAETLQAIVAKLDRGYQRSRREPDPALYENVLYRWLNGRIADRELRERAGLLGIDLGQDCYMACILRLDGGDGGTGGDGGHGGEGETGGEGGEGGADMPKAAELLGAHFADRGSAPMLLRSYEDELVLLFSGGSALGAEAFAAAERAAKTLGQKMGASWFFAMGGEASGYRQAQRSYRQAASAIGYSTMLSWPCGLDYAACAGNGAASGNGSARETALPPASLEKFRALLIRSPELAQGFLDGIFEQSYAPERFSPDYLSRAAVQLATAIRDAARHLFLDANEIFPDFSDALMLEDHLSRLTTRGALRRRIDRAAQRLACLRGGQRGAVPPPVVERALRYARANYMNGISLKSLAGQMGMNPAYLGRLLSEALDEPFSSYLNRLRVERAKELLRETGRSVSDIAKLVGYASANHFISTFRRYQGCLPGDYRQWR